MSVDGDRAGDGILSILELLVGEGAPDEIDKCVLDARRDGVSGQLLEKLEIAARLGLRIQAQTLRRRRRETGLSALVDTARELAMPQPLETLLQVVTRRARLLLGVEMAYLSLVDPADPDGHAVICAADGHTSTLSVGLRLPSHGGLGNLVVDDRAPFWTSDYLQDDRIPHDERIDEVVRAEGLNAMMAVPLSHGTEVSGTLYVAERKVRPFSADERSILGALGGLAGAAIEQARQLDRALAARAELEERASAAANALAQAGEVVEIQQQLIDLALRSDDMQLLLERARRTLSGPMRIRDAASTVLASAGAVPDCDETQVMRAMMSAHTEREPVELERGTWVVPVQAGAEHLGCVLYWPDGELTSHHYELLCRVAEAAALMMRQGERGASTFDVPGTDELLDELVVGRQRSPKRAGRRAARFGVDLARPHVVVIARPEAKAHGKVMIWASSYAQRRGGLKTIRDGSVVLLLPGENPGEVARAVAAELTPLLKLPVTVSGAGPVGGPDSLPHVYQEARRCLDAMSALGLIGGASSPTELGFLGALLSDNQDLDGFIASTIGPVIEHDRERASELVRTLDAYFATGCSPTRAAERLHVHPNTVARRLERIGELLEPGWQEPERALDVHLALRLVRIRRLIDERQSAGTGRAME